MKSRIFPVLFILLALSCAKGIDLGSRPVEEPQYADMTFAVFSDAHLFAPELGTGPAFEDYINSDRKLLMMSMEILDSAVSRIIASDAEFVLVPGDMTKDGEYLNHTYMTEYLARIEESGKRVFVVPGNHDLLNPDAFMYTNEGVEPVESVDPAMFEHLYSDFGYSDAMYRDSVSLSYVAGIADNVWLLAIDPCKYYMNEGKEHPMTSGVVSKETMIWIKDVLEKADAQGIAVMAMMHHGLVEHFDSQKKHFAEYIVDNNDDLAALLAYHNVRVIFTGHYHANDIVKRELRVNGKDCSIYDIETGSLVTFPSPIRFIEVRNGDMSVKTEYIDEINSIENFADFSYEYIYEGVKNIASGVIESYGVKGKDNEELASRVAELMVGHYAGDEKGIDNPADFSGMGFRAKLVGLFQKDMLLGLNHDLPPADNTLTIDLR